MKFHFPDYTKNIINVSSTFNKMLGHSTNIATLSKLEEYLKKDYKNVVFIILDGFGINPIKINLDKNNILRKNIKQTLTSVFPSTTTNATTTLMSGDYPFNHGWFGWSVYFDELEKAVMLYMDRDYYTGEKIDSSFVRNKLPFTAYYNDAKNYDVNTVLPTYIKDGNAREHYPYNSKKEMFENIKKCCLKDGKQFIYSYCDEPDHTMHDYGVASKEAKDVIMDLSSYIEDLHKSLKDTLIVITADHGHIDIDGYIEIYKNKELLKCLDKPMYLEPRATSFKVKEEKREEFKKIFNKCYHKDFKLFEVDYLVKRGVFGPFNDKNRVLLGDYIAVCKTNKQFVFDENSNEFKGHHTSLTKEMLVPLIIID
jgi:predicted AlkP superfamily pyrophosphatase or phosphodiesterase